MNELAKNLLLWVVIALVLMSVFSSFAPSTSNANEVPYSQFLDQVENGSVSQVNIEDQRIRGQLKSGQKFATFSPESDNKAMIGTLRQLSELANLAPEIVSIAAAIAVHRARL